MGGVNLEFRHGHHGGRETWWELSVSRQEAPDIADMIVKLPDAFEEIQHSGSNIERPAYEYINFPAGVTELEIGPMVAWLARRDYTRFLASLLYIEICCQDAREHGENNDGN